MKRIVIFSGGTGSIALQTGFYNLYGDSVKVDIIISAYDNGKSTGECRKVFNGKILGPSDLRKNQLTQYKLINRIGNPDASKEKRLLFDLFNERFTLPDWETAYDYIKSKIALTFSEIERLSNDSHIWGRKKAILYELVDYFFYCPYVGLEKQLRPSILTTSFSDFSISNMFYSAAAAINGNSLGLAGSLMSAILDIPNNVHLVSDVNLYLYAETKYKTIISDEGIIVAWNHPEDPIQNVSLLDEKGKKYLPSLDENNQTGTNCKDLIENADIIIFSSGTQWSSLIPTYMHKGVREAINKSHARKYLIMNNIADCDMKGLSAIDLLSIVERSLDLDDTTIVLNEGAESPMKTLPPDCKYRMLRGQYSEKGAKTHDAFKLVKSLMTDYYSKFINGKYYFLDFDDTIWSSSKDKQLRHVSEDNLRLLFDAFSTNSIIISGNSSNHFDALQSVFGAAQEKSKNKDSQIDIYCNGGNCHYRMHKGVFTYLNNLCKDYNLNDDYYILSENILKELNANGWNLSLSNFENRGNCILSIKPLKNREKARDLIINVIREIFHNEQLKYTPYINGNTTIDIMNTGYNKRMCASTVSSRLGYSPEEIVYIGDKMDTGNDACLKDMGFIMLKVEDVVDFNCFVRTYLLTREKE